MKNKTAEVSITELSLYEQAKINYEEAQKRLMIARSNFNNIDCDSNLFDVVCNELTAAERSFDLAIRRVKECCTC